MIEFIRSHPRLVQLALALITLPFAFFGLGSYRSLGEADNVVAKVGNQPITQQELEIAQREQLERIKQMFGGQIDPKVFDTPEAKKNALDGLIAQKAMSIVATRERLMPSDSQIQGVVLASFPSLADPSLSKDDRIKLYTQLAAEQGMSVPMLQSRIAQGMMRQTMNNSVQGSAFAPRTVAARYTDINNQEREVQQLLFKTADYVPQVKLTDALLKDYYNKHDAEFTTPEQAKAEYVVLSSDVVASQVAVSDDEIKSYYEQNKKRFTVEEQRRASHILIAVKKDASDKERAAAKIKAEELLAKVRKDPSQFAKLAKENSQDPGSAEHGGDLGFFEKGMMVKPFEDAAYQLKKGEISNVVQSDFGYHIIQLTDIKPGSVKPLDEVKSEIAAEIKKQKAAKKYAELADTFSNTVYEQSDSLKPVADKLNLKIETAANLTRQPNPSLAPGVAYNNAKFLNALFSDDAIKNKRNTDAIEVAPNTLIAGRIVDYRPATKRPFNEVESLVREHVTQIEAAKLAKKAGEEKLTALKAKDDTAGFADPKLVSRAKEEGLNRAALASVMNADVSKLPAYVGVDLMGQGYGIYRIAKVIQPANVDKAKTASDQQQLETGMAQQEMVAYIDALKQKEKVKILKPIASPVTSSDDK